MNRWRSRTRKANATEVGQDHRSVSRWIRRAAFCVLAGVLLLGGAGNSWSETLHVAPYPDASAVAPGTPAGWEGDGSREHPYRGLETAVHAAGQLSAQRRGERRPAPIVLRLAPGHYWLSPETVTEPTCGNCEVPETPVTATVGVTVKGRGIHIVGADDHGSVVHTRSGYGILVQDCEECVVRGLAITGGVRDRNDQATDAAVVVQRSSVTIEANWIHDNVGDEAVVSEVVVGIMGITGREGSQMRIVGNRIHGNSWDGIALYRDAQAEIVGNDIDGIDLARGRTVGGGRGVGIGLTWNAQAVVRGNRVARYWKGIGVFVDAQAEVEHNVVERIATWGLSLWDAGRGKPRANFRQNVIDSTGACGVAVVRESLEAPEPGSLVGNVISRSGQNPRYDEGEPYCFQMAIALHAAPESFPIRGNILFDNREPGDEAGSGDLTEDAVRDRVRDVCIGLSQWPATRESDFVLRHLKKLQPRANPSGPLRAPGLEGDWGWGRKP